MKPNNQTIKSVEIDILSRLIEEVKDFKLNFNPILVLDTAFKPIIISNSPLKFGILRFIAGKGCFYFLFS